MLVIVLRVCCKPKVKCHGTGKLANPMISYIVGYDDLTRWGSAKALDDLGVTMAHHHAHTVAELVVLEVILLLIAVA